MALLDLLRGYRLQLLGWELLESRIFIDEVILAIDRMDRPLFIKHTIKHTADPELQCWGLRPSGHSPTAGTRSSRRLSTEQV